MIERMFCWTSPDGLRTVGGLTAEEAGMCGDGVVETMAERDARLAAAAREAFRQLERAIYDARNAGLNVVVTNPAHSTNMPTRIVVSREL